MKRTDLTELHNITHVENLASILRHGILSNRLAAKLSHTSVAMSEIQARRAVKNVPGSRPLHEYACLYLNARNKMMFKLKMQYGDDKLCVLAVDTKVLDLPGVVIADSNASSGYARFAPSPAGLDLIDKELLFATSWKHPENPIREMRHGSIVCAEVLVPDRVPASLIRGVYVCSGSTQAQVQGMLSGVQTTVNPRLFFR